MTEAQFYITKDKNVVKCTLCSHQCLIKDGNTGICAARENQQGKLMSLVYGYPVAQNIDPIEKKPFFHFQPGSMSYSIGTLGCNLACGNCQNYDLSQAKNLKKIHHRMEFIDPEKIIELALGEGCQSIAYTYNEPTIFTEYALDIMKLAHQHGLKNVWVSNGFMSVECLEAIIPYLDAINVDLKSIDDDFYRSNCESRVAPVLNNLKYLKQESVHLEVTTLVIPTLTSDIEMLEQLANWLATELDTETPWHISRFSSEISWKLKSKDTTQDDIIYEAYNIGKEAGLKYVYVGNIPGDEKENTYCPKCRELVIRRLGYHIERMDNKGRCSSCDKNLDIID